MIKTEYFMTRSDNVILVRTYSTENFYIKQVENDLEYNEAIDIGELVGNEYKPIKYTYEETNKTIEEEIETEETLNEEITD